MKTIKFKFRPGDFVMTKFGSQGFIEELRYRDQPHYAVWHDKGEYVTYSEDQIVLKMKSDQEHIGFKIT